MTTVYDHRSDPPTAIYARGSCVAATNYVSAPLANLPPGLYLAGPDDPVPAGMVAVAWTRVIRDGLSVAVPTLEPAPLPTVPATTLSKLGLRRALRARGLESTLDAMLASSAQAAADWADATELRIGDPMLAQMLPAFQAAAGLTDQQIADMVDEARQ
jgi:hypothetical protein